MACFVVFAIRTTEKTERIDSCRKNCIKYYDSNGFQPDRTEVGTTRHELSCLRWLTCAVIHSILLGYLIAMHVLVFFTMYYMAHNSHAGACDPHA